LKLLGFWVRILLGVWEFRRPAFPSPSLFRPTRAASGEADEIAGNLACVFMRELSIRVARLPEGNRLVEKIIPIAECGRRRLCLVFHLWPGLRVKNLRMPAIHLTVKTDLPF